MEFIISNLHLELHSWFLEIVFDLISQRFAIFSTLISGYLPWFQGIWPWFQVTYSEFLMSYQDFRVHTLPVFALLPILSCPDFRVKNFEIQMSDIGSPILISGYILCKNLFSILCYLAQISRCMILISGYIPWNQGFILCTNQLSLL